MSSIFTKIINREVPAQIVWENDKYIAFLDINPVNPGHLLVVPKKEISYIFDMPDEDYKEIMMIAKFLATPLKIVTGAKRIGMAIEGFSIDHVHIHLIPINNINELDPNRARKASDEELAKMAEKIREEIKKIN